MYKKLISESLFEFKKGLDPIDSLGMGRRQIIKDWLDLYNIKDYTINDDLTIDVDNDVRLGRRNLDQFPEFIQFGVVEGFFGIRDNNFTSLRGCPKIVKGFFECVGNNLTSLLGCPKVVMGNFYCKDNKILFTYDSVRENCEVWGIVYVY